MTWRAVVVAGWLVCATAASGVAQAPADPRQALIDVALGRVRLLLINPVSAEFREVVAYPSGAVCGQVNSRSKAGEYEGFTRFVVRARRVSVFPIPPAGEFDLSQFTVEAMCQ